LADKNDAKDWNGDKSTFVQVYMAIYEFEQWEALQKMGNATCEEKKELAFKTELARIPLDGSTGHPFYLTRTERNWYRPMMYYMTVMDCNNQIE